MIRETIDELLSVKGMSKREFLRKIGLNSNAYNSYAFKNFQNMPVRLLTRMAWVLNVPFGFLSRIGEYDKFSVKEGKNGRAKTRHRT